MLAKCLQDIRLQEKYGLQNSPWGGGGGGKPYPASGLCTVKLQNSNTDLQLFLFTIFLFGLLVKTVL